MEPPLPFILWQVIHPSDTKSCGPAPAVVAVVIAAEATVDLLIKCGNFGALILNFGPSKAF